MGLSFGLERGKVSIDNLSKARTMVPKALEQYVVELAQKGPGNCANIPKVTPAKILKEEPGNSAATTIVRDFRNAQSDQDTDSEIDIN